VIANSGTATGGDAAVEETKSAPALDVVFCVDCSGSMGDIMPQVRQAMATLAARARNNFPGRTARFGLVRYGDSTRRFFVQDLNEDTQRFLYVVADTSSDRASEELVGDVIERATRNLSWSKRPDAAHLLYVVGNETAAQGPESYQKAIVAAREQGITVSMLYCPDRDDTTMTSESSVAAARNFVLREWAGKQSWIDAAKQGNGEFLQLLYSAPSGSNAVAIAWQPDAFLSAVNLLTGPTTLAWEQAEQSENAMAQVLTQAKNAIVAAKMSQAQALLARSRTAGATHRLQLNPVSNNGGQWLSAGGRISTDPSAASFFASHPALGGILIHP